MTNTQEAFAEYEAVLAYEAYLEAHPEADMDGPGVDGFNPNWEYDAEGADEMDRELANEELVFGRVLGQEQIQ